ncbi:MAG: tetratricopeptide repeat protein [Nitrospinales bacterium]
MSLIADSLKKALKIKETPDSTPPASSLLSRPDVLKSFRAADLRKYLLPGIAVAMSVAYLIYSGAFQKFGPILSHLPLGQMLGVSKDKPAPPLPTPQPRPIVSQPKPAPPAVQAPATTVEPFVPPLKFSEPVLAPVAEQAVLPTLPVLPPVRDEVDLPPQVVVKRTPRKRAARKPVKKKVAPPKTFFEPEREQQHAVLLTLLPPSKEPNVAFSETPTPEIFKNSNYYFNLGIFHHQAGEWKKALADYNRAAELSPADPEIHNNIGLIYKERKAYDAAIEQFMRALFIDPNFAKAYNNIGVVYYNLGDFQRAVANYQKAVQINPKNLETYNNLGVIYKKQEQLKKAESVFTKAYSLNPKHPGTNYNLALLYEEMNRRQSAIYFYRRFVKLGADTHPVLVSKVKAHLKSLGASVG